MRRPAMKQRVIGVAAMALSAGVGAQLVRFDRDAIGAAPAGWACGVTGKGTPRWTVKEDASAPSGTGKVLMQSGSGTFPWCVKSGSALADGFVEVTFKPLAGREDQAGGLVWRWQDGDTYYV